MIQDHHGREPDRHPLDALADEFAQRCRRGEAPSITEYADDHPELADQIERLFPSIAMMERLGQQEQSARRAARSRAARPGESLEQIGDYRIVREIGRGGMGIVYEAVQESLHRPVAVKVLARQALLDEKHLRRFRREAKTAARLHHTNIVPVFGVGEQDGYHYYVMQLIDGVGLDEVIAELKRNPGARKIDSVTRAIGAHVRMPDGGESPTLAEGAADATRVDKEQASDDQQKAALCEADRWGNDYWRQVAQMGLQVAQAMQYAHSQGTLHRDIKPANLLLDADGVVWIADFGLAKALEQDDVSRTGEVVGTPRYMAPEQFAGQSDHRSDIYSFGLTLYELLVLRPAFDDAGRTRMLLGAGKDSAVAPPRKVNPAAPRDLETIVLKAIAAAPRERYQTAGEMAADLHCFLEDRPIHARRSTAVEHLMRASRRNPAAAALSAVALTLLVLVALVASIGYVRTGAALERESQQRERAEVQRRKAESTLGISLEALDKVYRRFAHDRLTEPAQLTIEGDDGEQIEAPAQPVLSKETAALLEDILGFYDRFAQQDTGNVKLREEAAKANRRVGDIQQRLGAYEQAEDAYRRAIDRYEDLADQQGDDDRYLVVLAHLHNELGSVYRAWQRHDHAGESYRKAQQMLEPQAFAGQSAIEARFELARTYYFLGKHHLPAPGGPPGERPPGPPRRRFSRRGEPPTARRPPGPPVAPPFRADNRYLDRAIELLTDLGSSSGAHPERRYLLALCYRERSRDPRSDDAAKAIEIISSLSEQYPAVADYRFELSATHARLDMRSFFSADRQAVEERLRIALTYADELSAEHPNIPQYSHLQAQINHKLGLLLHHHFHRIAGSDQAQRLEEAERYHRDAVQVQSALAEKFPEAASYQVWLARMRHSFAEALRDGGKLPEARSTLESSIAALGQFEGGPPETRFIEHTLAEHYRSLAETLDRSNDREGADHARKQAERFGRSFPKEPFGPRKKRPHFGDGPRGDG